MSKKPQKPGIISRKSRVSSLIQRVLAEAMFDMRQIEQEDKILTVTGVEVSGDLKQAKVYFSSLTDTDLEFLQQNRIKLQKIIASQVHIKVTPILSFLPDPSISNAERIDAILNKLSADKNH